MVNLSIDVLGSLEISLGDKRVTALESVKVRALLAYLAVEADHPHTRDSLVGLLWPDYPEESARHNLRQALFNLRATLGDRDAEPHYFLIERDSIQLNRASNVSLDVDRFNHYFFACPDNLSHCVEDCAIHASNLEEMVKLYRGEFLQHLYVNDSTEFEEWVLGQRESLHQRILEAHGYLANYFELHADFQAARRHAARLLELDPWREEAHRQMMRVLARDGQRSAALAQYENCRKVLAEELGVEPSSQTRELYEQIRSGTLKPKAEPAAPVSSAPFLNLPVPLTPFIGREQELGALGQLLMDPQCRIITLVGPGGIGKTRLAIQAATDQCLRFRNGVFYVGLSGLSTLDHVIPAIAEALQFSFFGAIEPKIQLSNFLHEKELLLVLDNFEQLIQSARLVVEITENSPGVKLLITSREQLNVSGEWTFEVNGLSYPNFPSGNPPDPLHPLQEHFDDRLFEDYSAVALFIQSAKRARVGYKIEAEDYPAIAQICRAVGGIPLGLELASTWVRTLTCTEIAREIDSSLDFLATSGWGIPERHKSMRAVFDHSWNLLNEDEQRVLGWLSVFRGEFTRQAAKQIAGASLSILSGLIVKSFLRRQSTGRYDMHELLRQYAKSKAQTAHGRFEAVEGRHSAYYLEIVRRLEHPLVGLQPVQARAEFVADIENIRPAWEYAVRHDWVEVIKGSINSFWNFYESHTWYHEAVKTFGLAADEIERACRGSSQMDATHIILYEYLRCCQGWFYLHIGKFQKARSILEEGVKTLRSRGALAELSRSLHYLGVIYWQAGEYTRALELFHEKENIDLPGGISWNLGLAYGNLGMVTETMGLFQESRDYFQKTISIFRTVGDIRLLGIGLFYLGSVENRLGMVQEGKAHLYESLEVNRSVGDRFGISMACIRLGLVFQIEENHAEAQRMFQESLKISREMGEKWIMQQSLVNIGFSKYALGDPAEAQACFLQSLQLASETQLIPCILDSLAGIALIYAGQGKAEDTLELVIHLPNHPAMTQETKVRVDQLRGELESRLTPDEIEAAQQRAGEMSLDEIVRQLLAGI